MVNITLSIPARLHERMKKYPEIKWSEIARKAIAETIKKMEEAELRELALARLREGEDARELFEF